MKIAAIIGATGAQGGGVARLLHKSGEWQVRGITRNVNSKSAQSLKAEGIEVAAANLDDHESLMKAFQVSNPISHFDPTSAAPPPKIDPQSQMPQPRDPCS